MLLLQDPARRREAHDLALGATTAVVAGIVNVASVMAFFAFSSNVTGHVAIFTEELVKGHSHQVSVVLAWLLAFLSGAVVANLLIGLIGARRPALGHAMPVVLQISLLLGIGYYCQRHYIETLQETEQLVAGLLFAMGLQNSTVASVSRSVVKTTHLTGLFTDLGMEISMLVQGGWRRDGQLRFKLMLHATILCGYLVGGVVGGIVYSRFQYLALYLAAALMGLILAHDIVLLARRRAAAGASDANLRRSRADPYTPGHAE